MKLALICLLILGRCVAQGIDPQPRNATQAILEAFDKYQLVGMGAAHGLKDRDDFILALIQNPAFPAKVNDIVVECGNRLYQKTLDRYIAGEDVAVAEMQLVWRNTTQQMCSLSGFYEQLFPLVRQINQRLPAGKRLRVVAADPPIDWSALKDQAEYIAIRNARGSSITSVITKEVLAKKRKALLLFGEGHLYHKGRSSVAEYEKTHPGVTLVIATHQGFGSDNPLDVHNDTLEARMKSWPAPSLVPVRGTWLADLDFAYYSEFIIKSMVGLEFADCVDAYLYLGPRDSLHRENVPPGILNDQQYIEELNRRSAGDVSLWPFRPIDVAARRSVDPNRPFYVSTKESRTPDAQMPLAKFVGTYTGESQEITINLHQGKLFAKMSTFPSGIGLMPVTGSRFRAEASHDATLLDFDIINERVTGLTIERGASRAKVKLHWNPLRL
jgi:hypothetical protein